MCANIRVTVLQILVFSLVSQRCSPGPAVIETAPPRAVFSDLDGTLLHYSKHFIEHGVTVTKEDSVGHIGIVKDQSGEVRLCRLFRSSTLGNGFMSYRLLSATTQFKI